LRKSFDNTRNNGCGCTRDGRRRRGRRLLRGFTILD
jgi:hypothetical protein